MFGFKNLAGAVDSSFWQIVQTYIQPNMAKICLIWLLINLAVISANADRSSQSSR
jgi:hypothetical protein